MISLYFCQYILFVRYESVSPVYTSAEELHKGMNM